MYLFKKIYNQFTYFYNTLNLNLDVFFNKIDDNKNYFDNNLNLKFIIKKKFIKDFYNNLELLYNNVEWIDIWNIDTEINSLENMDNLPWNLYFKYKLSMINSWHILEERFLIFFLLIIFCFF